MYVPPSRRNRDTLPDAKEVAVFENGKNADETNNSLNTTEQASASNIPAEEKELDGAQQTVNVIESSGVATMIPSEDDSPNLMQEQISMEGKYWHHFSPFVCLEQIGWIILTRESSCHKANKQLMMKTFGSCWAMLSQSLCCTATPLIHSKDPLLNHLKVSKHVNKKWEKSASALSTMSRLVWLTTDFSVLETKGSF